MAESLLGCFGLKNQAERFFVWLDQGYMSAFDRASDVSCQNIEGLANVRTIKHSDKYNELEHLASHATGMVLCLAQSHS